MWDLGLVKAEDNKLQHEVEATGPPSIKIDSDAIIILPDGTKIEITAGIFPKRPVLNHYVKGVCERRGRLYSVLVKRPTGDNVNINASGVVVTKPNVLVQNLKFRTIHALNSKEKSSLKNLSFMTNENDEVVNLVQNYDKE